MGGDFFDTNVLVYAASEDDLKFERAEALIASGGTISVQVLNAFANVARRKMRLGWPAIRHFLGGVRDLLNVIAIDTAIHEKAFTVAERHRIAFYDALIVASALTAECTTLFTEDLHDGMIFEGRLQVINPFRVSL
jgi:predicted nucleic acid-binding protein